jgi:hypothetical protein
MEEKLGDAQPPSETLLRTVSANSIAQRLKMSPLTHTLADIE